jgi:CBS domain-containing protein
MQEPETRVFDNLSMVLVQHIIESARRRLAVVDRRTSVCEAAAILANPNTPLVVVCDRDGIAMGVISRTNVLARFSRAAFSAPDIEAEAVMTQPIHACRAYQTLQSVWELMGARRVRCLPVLDNDQRPHDVVHARDVARAPLDEVANEELLLRDYVLGIGYQ